MSINNLPLFGMLRSKLTWLNERQSVIADNVANASTPGFKANDLKELSFDEMLRGAKEKDGVRFSEVEPSRVHISRNSARFKIGDMSASESTPNGNNVSLEDQMMRSAEVQVDYQAAIDIYKKGMNLLKMAVSGR